jgi:hypothetical protein
MPARSLLVFCAMLLLTAAACPKSTHTATERALPPQDAYLAFDSGTVRLISQGEAISTITRPGTVPYRVVREADPAIVTTCGANLVPRTFVIGSEISQFDDMLPQLVEPPVIVLFTVSAEEDTPGGRIVLIGLDGLPVYQSHNAQVLLPAEGPAGSPVLVAPTADSFLKPFGETPTVLAVDPITGKIAWGVEPPVRTAPDDIELLCTTRGFGLLSLQYGYTLFQYLSVNLETGEMAELHDLGGQPFATIVQPGTMPAYRGLTASDGVAELLVFDEQLGAGMLSFDLAGGTVEFTAREVSGPVTVEENVMPIGGGLAQPEAPPYPQSLLPTEFGDDWTITALTDGARYLVIDGDGAAWVNFP